MILVKDNLELYDKVCSLVKEFKSNLVGELDVHKLADFLQDKGMYVGRVEYDGHDLDLEIETLGISFTSDLKPSPILLMMNVPNGFDYADKNWEYEQAVGGWVEYNINTGIKSFPFMIWNKYK